MNFISNIFSYVKNTFIYFTSNTQTNLDNESIDELIIDEPIIIEPSIQEKPEEKIYYFFINTANIYTASKSLINRLKDYKGQKIKIYLLKSHTLEPLFKGHLVVNDYHIEQIENKLEKKHRHFYTFIDAVESFIEYNNIRNYHVFY